jgi:5-methylcytosine-specific restriction endonuclease McrA
MQVLSRPPSGWPALVLNADFRPLSYYPLSLWPWQDVIKAVFLDRVDVVSTYDQVVHSPSFEMQLPSVVSLKQYVTQDRPPARQYWQVKASRRKRLNRVKAGGRSCVTYCFSDTTLGNCISKDGECTTWS